MSRVLGAFWAQNYRYKGLTLYIAADNKLLTKNKEL